MNESDVFHICISGKTDFLRRMQATITRISSRDTLTHIESALANISEMYACVITARPQLLVVEIGSHTTYSDLIWIRKALTNIRQRFDKRLYITLAVTTPEKFGFAGSLLFKPESSLEPSELIDNLIISPPTGIPSILSLEGQLENCIEYVYELYCGSDSPDFSLPALASEHWVPAMCDPESRDVWMRWLPRYARYINENPIIVGPTGSGKTRLAQAIHTLSKREGPFISITPRDFSSPELVQAELFGAVPGAYTGAVEKWGLVHKAEKGTLFIDELQSIDRDLQGKLITFIENKTYRRVGEAENHLADVRFVFATNKTLHDLVQDGSLRDDFAYRLERLQIALSPLHTRQLDISAALCYSLAKILKERAQAQQVFSESMSNAAPGILEGLTSEAYSVLFSARWPGNLRQLENTVAKLIELADIRALRLIDTDCTGTILQGLLGNKEISAADIFEKAAISVALRARTDGYDNIDDCIFALADHARLESLNISGGDIEEAALLIGDSDSSMNLFAASWKEDKTWN